MTVFSAMAVYHQLTTCSLTLLLLMSAITENEAAPGEPAASGTNDDQCGRESHHSGLHQHYISHKLLVAAIFHISQQFQISFKTFLKILLSESNKQQQDISDMKDDLGIRKFGYSYLQHTTTELSADSSRQGFQLK